MPAKHKISDYSVSDSRTGMRRVHERTRKSCIATSEGNVRPLYDRISYLRIETLPIALVLDNTMIAACVRQEPPAKLTKKNQPAPKPYHPLKRQPTDGLTSDCEIDATALGPARTSSSTSSLKTRISCNRRHRLRCASVSVRRHLHRRSVPPAPREAAVGRICHPTHRDTRPRIGTCHAVHHHQVVVHRQPATRHHRDTRPRIGTCHAVRRQLYHVRPLRHRSHEERPSCAPFAAHAVFTEPFVSGADATGAPASPSEPFLRAGPTPLYRSVQRAARAVPTSAPPPYASSFVSTPIDGATLRSSRRQQQQQTSSRMIALSMAPHIILRVVSSSSRHLHA
ncbi:unnamed protein product [Trichogramma brassicae]|uniref:Uncharacterized protein n=1 Tax=Trichogramma brassicae TaxID=86971 RepID=A0A6H5I4J4_9HYME|nr:unnamed protein product [Trichogramma brassicae]